MAIRNRTFFPPWTDEGNLIINGGFEIAQRSNVTFNNILTLTAANKANYLYPIDRWAFDITATATTAPLASMSLIALNSNQELPARINTYGHSQFALRLQQTIGRFAIGQAIENCRAIYNRPFGWSFFFYTDDDRTAEHKFTVSFIAGFISGGVYSTTTLTSVEAVIPTANQWHWVSGEVANFTPAGGQWRMFSDPGSVSNNDSFVMMRVSYAGNDLIGPGTLGSDMWFTGFRVNIGQAQPYIGRHPAEELALCERYYEKTFQGHNYEDQTDLSCTAGAWIGKGGNFNAGSAAVLDYFHRYRVRKRPTVREPRVIVYASAGTGGKNRVYNISLGINQSATTGTRWLGETGCRIQTEATASTESIYMFHVVADHEYSLTDTIKVTT